MLRIKTRVVVLSTLSLLVASLLSGSSIAAGKGNKSIKLRSKSNVQVSQKSLGKSSSKSISRMGTSRLSAKSQISGSSKSKASLNKGLSPATTKAQSRLATTVPSSTVHRFSQSRMKSVSRTSTALPNSKLATISRTNNVRDNKLINNNRLGNKVTSAANVQIISARDSKQGQATRLSSNVRGFARDQLNKLVDQSKFNQLTGTIPSATSRVNRGQMAKGQLPDDAKLPESRQPAQLDVGNPGSLPGLPVGGRVGNLNDASFRGLVSQSRSGGDRNSNAMEISVKDTVIGVVGAVGGQVGAAIATADGVAKTLENPTVTNVADTVASAVGLSGHPVAGAFSTSYGVTRMVDEGTGLGDMVVDSIIAEQEGRGGKFREGEPVKASPKQTPPDADPSASALGPGAGGTAAGSSSQSGTGSQTGSGSQSGDATQSGRGSSGESTTGGETHGGSGASSGEADKGGKTGAGADDSGNDNKSGSGSSRIPDPNTSALGPAAGGSTSGGGAGENETGGNGTSGRPNPMQDDLQLDEATKAEIERSHADARAGLVNPGPDGKRQIPNREELQSEDRASGNPRQGWAINPGTGQDQRATTDLEAVKARFRNGLVDPPKPSPGVDGVGPVTNDIDRPDPKNPPRRNPTVSPESDA